MLPSAPLLSIIIVAYKSRDEIAGCLESLPPAVGGRNVEIVVVDNSPGDGTGALIARQYLQVKYIAPAANLGFGRANNLGFAETNSVSKFVLFLNPDTVCNEAALTHCIARLQADERIGLISPKLVLADGSMDLACRRGIPTLWDGFCRATGLAARWPNVKAFSGYNLTHLPEGGTYDVGAINGAFMMGRREVFEAVAPPVEDLKLKIREGVSPGGETPDEAGKLKFKEDEKVERSELRVEGPELKGLSAQSSEAKTDTVSPSSSPPPTASSLSPIVSRLPPSASFVDDSAGLPRQSAEPDHLAMTGSVIEPTANTASVSSTELKAHRLQLTAAGAPRPHVFDESFFMYGDDLDLCIRVARAGWRIVYDGSMSITHLKGMSVAKDYNAMSSAIFDANRDVYLKHFNPTRSRLVAWKYRLAFGLWKQVARLRAVVKGHRRVRPL